MSTRTLLPREASTTRPKPGRKPVGIRNRGLRLAGSPLVENREVLTTVNRGGRPRIYATDAERQAHHRLKEEQQRAAKLINEILQIAKSQRAHATNSIEQTKNRRRQRALAADLRTTTETQLIEYREVLKNAGDQKGKLPGESTGGEAKGAASRVVNALMAQETKRTGKVAMEGTDPQRFWGPDQDGSDDYIGDEKPSTKRKHKEPSWQEESYEEALTIVCPEPDYICVICQQHGIDHVRNAYRAGERQIQFIKTLEDYQAERDMPEGLINEARKNLEENTHYYAIRKLIRILHRQELAATKMSRKLTKLGKAERVKHQTELQVQQMQRKESEHKE